MSRSRNIKPGFFKNDLLAECDPLARLLFAGLWCLADREGRLEDRPKKIKAECLPYDDCDCDALLDQLAGRGFIVRYVVDSVGYILIGEFKKHQNPHVKEQASTIPAPPTTSQGDDMPGASTVQAPEIPERAGLIPDSLSLDSPSLIHDPLQKKGTPSGGDSPNGSPPADPIWGTGLAFLQRKGLPEPAARKFLGKLKKEVGDIKAGAILAQAEAEDVSDPVPWLMAASQRANKPAQTKTRQLL